jgi:hypothetical protein
MPDNTFLIEDVTVSIDAAKRFVANFITYGKICEEIRTEISTRNGTPRTRPLIIAELGPDAKAYLENKLAEHNFSMDLYVKFARTIMKNKSKLMNMVRIATNIASKNTLDV